MSAQSPQLKLQVGGAVNSRKFVYIIRPSDDEVFDLLSHGEYCNVLCSRQMGKTSLLLRTKSRLADAGVRAALIDVAGLLGRPENADSWYIGLLQEVARQLGLQIDVPAWWQASSVATANQRLIAFFRDEAAVKITKTFVVILDEIDSTLRLPFTDDFFIALRAMYNDRARESAFERVSFCLVGVATPNELIKDRLSTPYNVGRTIELGDFRFEQDDLRPLQKVVADDPKVGELLVYAVLSWTGGHPFLTIKLCNEVVKARATTVEDVRRLVDKSYQNLESVRSDGHFATILRFFQPNGVSRDELARALDLYRRVWLGRDEVDKTTLVHIRLKLAGVIKRGPNGRLVVRNAIYRQIFTESWARMAISAVEHPRFGELPSSENRFVEESLRNRRAMLEKVRKIWITGYLERSVYREVRILLGLSESPDAVARPLDLLVKRPDEREQRLPAGTEIVDVFDSMGGGLLILGAPGSGKTTLLLQLAGVLLTRATDDATHPIPVIFPLSTWSGPRKPLVEWLRDELNLRYDVPRGVAQEFVGSNQILPLLDGLDEVGSENRVACIEAIDSFRQSHGLLPLVVTSRTAEYLVLAERLRLDGAIVVQPLSREQVIGYLTELGPVGERIRAALREDPTLLELLDSPLLIHVATIAYAGQVDGPVPMSGSVTERRDHLLRSYVEQTLGRRAAEGRYTRAETVHWLSWLASQMAAHGQSVFHLEKLQLDWLPQRQWRIIGLCNRLVGGLLGVLFGVLVGGLISGLAGGLIGALVVGQWSSSDEIKLADRVRWRTSTFPGSPTSIVIIGLVGGLVAGLVVGQFGGLSGALFGKRAIGRLGGLLIGLVLGLLSALIVVLYGGMVVAEIQTTSVPNEGVRRTARHALRAMTAVGLVSTVLFGLVVELESAVLLGLVLGLIAGLRTGGERCLKHYILRLWLVRNRSTPWNYVRFLDYATDRILLRKVGGGYVFFHRMLMDYFAAQHAESAVENTADHHIASA